MYKPVNLLLIFFGFCLVSASYYYKNKKHPVLEYEIINEYNHDTSSWCQGLEVSDGFFYEGTGRKKGLSTLRKVEIKTGKVIKKISLDERYFGEGITIWNDFIFQLTYTSGEAFVYDRQTLNLIKKFKYSTEGWGLTNDGKSLIMSDGSSTIRFIDPDTFKELRKIKVRNNGFLVSKLNELEYVNGNIYANILFSDYIVRISSDTGKVNGWINLTGLLDSKEREKHDVDVMNCIAENPLNGNLYVTGKLWPKLFEIKVIN